jgi:hypothetical protein
VSDHSENAEFFCCVHACTRARSFQAPNIYDQVDTTTDSGAGAQRHDQRRRFYVDIVIDSPYVEMDVVREREGCLNGSEVEGGMKKV